MNKTMQALSDPTRRKILELLKKKEFRPSKLSEFLVIERKESTKGQIFNIGGGIENSVSIWREFGPILEKIHGGDIPVKIEEWRPGDQKIYISDISKVKNYLGWSPKISVEKGLSLLYHWVAKNKELFA